jgi:hypothetical protein
VPARYVGGVVAAVEIEDEELVCPRHRREAFTEAIAFVPAHDAHRDHAVRIAWLLRDRRLPHGRTVADLEARERRPLTCRRCSRRLGGSPGTNLDGREKPATPIG